MEESSSAPTAKCPSAQATKDATSSTNGRDSPHSNVTESSPSSVTEHLNGNSAARPSHLPCNSKDVPLSPALALTPGNGHSQLPTPPSHASPLTSPTATGNFVESPIVSMMRQSSTDMMMSPTGDLSLHNYPPLPPPESLLAGCFHDQGSYSPSAVSPICESAPLHSLHSLPAQEKGATAILRPPPYSFSTKHCSTSSDMLFAQLPSYNRDPMPSSNKTFLSLSNPSKSFSTTKTTVSLNNGPSAFSPTTLSPITNSDCSLTEASPLTQDVTLPAPENFPSAPSTSCRHDVVSLQDDGPSFITRSHSISSPIHAKEPVVLTDLQEKEWELYSMCPVIQTGHDMWAANPPQMLANSSKSSPPLSASNAESPQHFSAMYGMGFFPTYSSEPHIGNHQYPVSNVSNGAK